HCHSCADRCMLPMAESHESSRRCSRKPKSGQHYYYLRRRPQPLTFRCVLNYENLSIGERLSAGELRRNQFLEPRPVTNNKSCALQFCDPSLLKIRQRPGDCFPAGADELGDFFVREGERHSGNAIVARASTDDSSSN